MVQPAYSDPPPRLLLPSSHADVRVTWHREQGLVLSLWHGRICAASAPLSTEEAARVAGFIVDHLGARAAAADAAAADVALHGEHAATVPLGLVGDGEAGHRDNEAFDPDEHGAAHRTVAAIDEAVAAGGAALAAAVDAARRTWRSHRR